MQLFKVSVPIMDAYTKVYEAEMKNSQAGGGVAEHNNKNLRETIASVSLLAQFEIKNVSNSYPC